MRVWFHPADVPGIYAVDRTDPENPVFIISDGLPVDVAVACAARFATVEERNWVRAYIGSAPVCGDPTHAHTDKLTGGAQLWDRSMIPAGLLWEGRAPITRQGHPSGVSAEGDPSGSEQAVG